MKTLFDKTEWQPGRWLAAAAMALLLVAGTAAEAASATQRDPAPDDATARPPAPQARAGVSLSSPAWLAAAGGMLMLLAVAPPRRRRD